MNILMLLSKEVTIDPRVLREARTLLDAGHRVTVVQWDRHRRDAPRKEERDGLRIVRVAAGPARGGAVVGNPFWWRAAARAARRLHAQEPFDALHCHDLDTLPAGAALKRRTGLPLVFDAHEVFAYMVEADHSRLVSRAAQALEDRLLRRVDRIVTVNAALEEFYRRRSQAPVTVVANCPPLGPPAGPPPAGPFTVTFVGLLHASRFFPDAVHALGGLEGVRFVVAGKPEGCYAEVEAAARRYPNVEFLGTVAPARVPGLTARSHAVLSMLDPASRLYQVASPNKLYEAMVAGRPLVTTRGTHSGDLVEREGIGVAVDYSAPALQEAIQALAADPAACGRMGERGRRLAESGYHWGPQGARLAALYEGLR